MRGALPHLFIAACIEDVATHFQMVRSKPCTLAMIKQEFEKLSQAEMDDMASHCRMYVGTAQYGDLIGLPSGYIVAQKTTSPIFAAFQVPLVQPCNGTLAGLECL